MEVSCPLEMWHTKRINNTQYKNIRGFSWLLELYEVDFHKQTRIYGSGRVWANGWDALRRTPSRCGRGRQAAVDFVMMCFGMTLFSLFSQIVWRCTNRNSCVVVLWPQSLNYSLISGCTCCCCLHIKPFFLPNDVISSTPSVLPDSSCSRDTNSVAQATVREKPNAKESRWANQALAAYRVREVPGSY